MSPPSRYEPRVAISEDVRFEDFRLSALIQDVGAKPVVANAWSSGAQSVDLVIVQAGCLADLEGTLGTSPASGDRATTPVLGVVSLDRAYMPLVQLCALGVVGLIDRRATPEQIRVCLRELLYVGKDRRNSQRAPCCLPLEIEAPGVRSAGFTTNLSDSGMGIATRCELPRGVLLVLRWATGEGPEDRVEVTGRVVDQRRSKRSDADYEVGIAFESLSERTRAVVSAQVERILDALGCLELDFGAPPATLDFRPGFGPPRADSEDPVS